MYIVDGTYLTRELAISDAQGQSVTRTDAKENIEKYLDDAPREVLIKALGYELAYELESYTTDGVLNNDAPLKWQNLVNGVIYQYNGDSYKWDGLIFSRGTMKKSLLANFVFTQWLEDNVSSLGSNGNVIIQTRNGASITSNRRWVKAYNEFLSMYQGDYLVKDDDYYCNINWYDRMRCSYYDSYKRCYNSFSKIKENKVVSLLTFLDQNESDYENAALMSYGKPANVFGI